MSHKHRFELIEHEGKLKPACVDCGKVDFHDPEKEAQKELRRQVKLAIQTRTTVPYSLGQLVDAGIGIDTIRKVFRS